MSDGAPTTGLAGAAREMVLDYLARRGSTHRESATGVLVVPLADAIPGSPWQAWIAAAGAEDPALVVQVRAAHRIDRAGWPAALEVCNAWNRAARLTKAWLAVADWDRSSDGSYVVEATLPLAGTAEQPMVDEFVDAALLSAVEFWRRQLQSMWQRSAR
jgi:hypothetical protein